MEEWKDVSGYEDIYEVSDKGKIRSLDRFDRMGRFHMGHERIHFIDNFGYPSISLWKDGKRKTKRIHRIEADSFLGESSLHIDHIDGDKTNNNLSNLEYVTNRENTSRGHVLRRRKKKGLPVGVYQKREGRYFSTIRIGKQVLYLGTFDTISDARGAYLEAIPN